MVTGKTPTVWSCPFANTRETLNARSAAQLVTKFVPEGKIKSRPSGIVVGGACSCCEAGGRSIPRGSVTDYSSAKRKNSSGTSTSHNSAAATRKVPIPYSGSFPE